MAPANARLFRHILCPVDFSEYSRAALRRAVALARKSKARLTVLFVNDPLLGPAAAAVGYDVKALDAKTHAELRRFIARAMGERAPAAAIETALGEPASEIQTAAQRLGADLVVMGSRGLTGPNKWFFGSTTARVLKATGVPVLVVPKERRAGLAPRQSWPGKRILVPVDLQDYALADVREAVDIVRALDASPLFLYAIPPVQFPPWLRLGKGSHDRDRIETARTQLEKVAHAVGGQGECRVVIGDPVDQIAACAADARSGLIVLTLKRTSAPFALRQGTITYGVLSAEVAPILALPEKGSGGAGRRGR